MLGPDGENPTAPGNLTATLNGARVDLGWDASSDDLGVTGYKIYRDGALISEHQSGHVLVGHERLAR